MRRIFSPILIGVSAASSADLTSNCTAIEPGFYSAMIGENKIVSIELNEGDKDFVFAVSGVEPSSGELYEWKLNQPVEFKLEPDCNISIANESMETYALVMNELANLSGVNYTRVSTNSSSNETEATYIPEDFVLKFGSLHLIAEDDSTSSKSTTSAPLIPQSLRRGHYLNQLIGGIVAVVRVINEQDMALTVIVPGPTPRVVRTLVEYLVEGDKVSVSSTDNTTYINLAFIEMLLQTLGDLPLSPEFSFTYCEECKMLKVGSLSLKLDEAVVKLSNPENEISRPVRTDAIYH